MARDDWVRAETPEGKRMPCPGCNAYLWEIFIPARGGNLTLGTVACGRCKWHRTITLEGWDGAVWVPSQ